MARMGVMQLGSLRWRVDPNSVDWNFKLDISRIYTLGGQVVQILGSTLSDLVITGDFGQDHQNDKVSWQLAEAFNARIIRMMEEQTQRAKTVQQSQATSGKKRPTISDAAHMHKPWHLRYHDGLHNWHFQVMIKSMEDLDGGSIVHSNGKFNYKYRLTLFIVISHSELLHKVATDYFLSRISEGLGWHLSKFNGPMDSADAIHYIQANGGSITAYLDKVLTGENITDQSPLPAQPNNPNSPGVTHPIGGGTAVSP